MVALSMSLAEAHIALLADKLRSDPGCSDALALSKDSAKSSFSFRSLVRQPVERVERSSALTIRRG